MLNDFENKIASLRSFDFGNEMEAVIDANADKIPDLVAQQLAAGKDGNDQPVLLNGNPNYQPATIDHKKKFGQGLGAITDRVTNYMTGALYEDMKTKVDGGTFETTSDVPYFGDIIERSGDQIMEVNESNRNEFAQDIVMPAIKDSFKSKTGFAIS